MTSRAGTTTIRVPVEVRDHLAALADEAATTQVAILRRAIEAYETEEFWRAVQSSEPDDVSLRQELAEWDRVSDAEWSGLDRAGAADAATADS
jgi:predicted DNA-binding protein